MFKDTSINKKPGPPQPLHAKLCLQKIKLEQWRTQWNFTWQTLKRKKKGEQPLYLEPFSCPTDRTRKLRLYCKNQPITALADIWWVLSSLFTVKDSHSADGTDVTSLPVQQMVVIVVVVVVIVVAGGRATVWAHFLFTCTCGLGSGN